MEILGFSCVSQRKVTGSPISSGQGQLLGGKLGGPWCSSHSAGDEFPHTVREAPGVQIVDGKLLKETYLAKWNNISPNRDFPEIRGPISLPKRYLSGENRSCEVAII